MRKRKTRESPLTPATCSDFCNIVQHTATHFGILQHTTTHYNTPQHTSTYCSTLQNSATQCNTVQHIATHCNTLQHTATHGNTRQHTWKAPEVMPATYSEFWLDFHVAPVKSASHTYLCVTRLIHTCNTTHSYV